jgi:hypothetical protein
MRCPDPGCTGVHDNNRYHELCPRSLRGKRDRDYAWHGTPKGRKKRWRAYISAYRLV